MSLGINNFITVEAWASEYDQDEFLFDFHGVFVEVGESGTRQLNKEERVRCGCCHVTIL